MPAQNGPVCARCGDTVDRAAIDGAVDSQAPGAPQCRACRLAPPPFVRAVSYGTYTGRMREAVHALKYQGLHPASRQLGRMLAAAVVQLQTQAPAEMLVVPVPLHRRKRRERGFNQTLLLASEAVATLRASNVAWRLTLAPDTLVRQRATGSQAGLTPRQRRLNVRNAFKVRNPEAVAGKHILVVDDILTTGATVRAVSRAFTAAGAESVWVATLARARRIHAEGFNNGESLGVFADSVNSMEGSGNAPVEQLVASTYQRSF